MRYVKPMVVIVLVAALMGAGWLLRGMLAGGAPAGAPGMAHGPGGAPAVVTATVRETSLRPPAKYVGHVEAIQSVEIYAQVEGTIQEVHFKEGALVDKDDLLFTIDPRRYQAKVELAEATLSQTKASLVSARAALESVQAQLGYAQSYLQRLQKAGSRSVVQADVDKAQSDLRQYQASERDAKAKIEQLQAQVKQSQADLEVARIDLAYTQVRSPIAGRIGRAEVTAGGYVSPGNVLMARVVQVDPVRVRLAISDRDYLDLLKIGRRDGLEAIKASLVLANGDTFTGDGALDFVGNRMTLETGTISLRLRYANPGRELVPNSYVTVLLETPGAPKSAVVPQEAVMTDQNGEYVYVVGSDGVAQRRDLKLGDSFQGQRIVLSGLQAGETVVVQGLQRVRPGQPVKQAQNGKASAATSDGKGLRS